MGTFEPLPSAMQMVESGNTDPIVKRMAQQQRAGLRTESLIEQAFALLWDQYGTGDDDDRDLVWHWREAFTWIHAGLRVYPPSKQTPEFLAMDFDATKIASSLGD